jgi:hypothetical protein
MQQLETLRLCLFFSFGDPPGSQIPVPVGVTKMQDSGIRWIDL